MEAHSKLSEPRRTPSSGTKQIHASLMMAHAEATKQQQAAGRSPEGRGWAIVATKIEEALAINAYHDPGEPV